MKAAAHLMAMGRIPRARHCSNFHLNVTGLPYWRTMMFM